VAIDVTLRPAGPQDAAAVAAIHHSAWPEDGCDEARIRQALQQPGNHCSLALADGQAAAFVDGFLTCAPDGRLRWEVDLLAVAPPFRGQRLGEQLVRASREYGRRQGAALGRGLVQVDNVASQRTFARSEFALDPTRYLLYTCPADPLEGGADVPAQPAGRRAVEVATFNYSGLWVEEPYTEQDLEAALEHCAVRGLDLVGTLTPEDEPHAWQRLEALGFRQAGCYQWWRCHYPAGLA
jgi:ribosomal-protein-alanine N-acetyltransferase